ncbi:hypothetical protein D0Z00_002979 [Geotrichum galactomycetum]|uniref:Uncharacterized protein n=1 Tax=Geotrichum galactomycetum TaxID=27317 RepID=A0ACB6V2J3_9ASCO|nr:hypothetical protein D0Z00_002979 [Geotrichum candidum]
MVKSKVLNNFTFFIIPATPKRLHNIKQSAYESAGAQVIDTLEDEHTPSHIVLVNKEWTYAKVLAYLKVDELPKLTRVVKDEWVSRCIENGKVVEIGADDEILPTTVVKNEPQAEPSEIKQEDKDKFEVLPVKTEESNESDESEYRSNHENTEEPTEKKRKPARDHRKQTGKTRKLTWDSVLLSQPHKVEKTESGNPNQLVIDIFSHLENHYTAAKDTFRALAYRRAVATLKQETDRKITTAEEAIKLKGIGEHLAEQLQEIVETHHSERLDYFHSKVENVALEVLMGIYGVGPAKARRWVGEGVRTLEDALARPDLTPQQRIGIEHYDDFNTKMPRAETQQHFEIVKTVVQKLDKDTIVECMGSYRRKEEFCGDIDIIITLPIGLEPDTEKALVRLREVLLNTVVILAKQGFLTCALTGPDPLAYDYNVSRILDAVGSFDRWYGASTVPSNYGVWRRIDLLIVPPDEIGATRLYFTGNGLFNRTIRLLAQHKGFSLTQHGLFRDVARGKRREKLSEGLLVESKSEHRIFDILEIPYREPEERSM